MAKKIKIDTDVIKALYKKVFQDKYEKILQDLLELEIENPADIRVKHKIAEIHFRKNHVEESIAKYKEIAQYYEEEDFILKAIDACKNILKIRPELVDFNIKLSALYLKLGMTNEAANQLRIAVNHYAGLGDSDKTVGLAQDLVKVDPSNENRAKLAEIYQSNGMREEAFKQYNVLADSYRDKKDYDKLLHFYELLLPQKKDDGTLLRDVCILNLRKENPQRVMKLLEQYKKLEDPEFKDLVNKAKLMMQVIRKGK